MQMKQIGKEMLGTEHPDALTSMANLAFIPRDQLRNQVGAVGR